MITVLHQFGALLRRLGFIGLLSSVTLGAQVQLAGLTIGPDAVGLTWQGGYGPYLVESSRDLVHWSGPGEPVAGTTNRVPAFAAGSFYRVLDLNPANQLGDFFGLIQTEQSEFGPLLGRHRLKARMWLYKSKGSPHNLPAFTPANYWRKLLIQYQYPDDGQVRVWSGALEDLGIVTIPASQQMMVTWTKGSGGSRRVYSLTLDFPYAVNASRTKAPFPSDPTYTLKCDYAAQQPELETISSKLGSTRADSVHLIQLAPEDPGDPSAILRQRKYTVSKNGVKVNLRFYEGFPLYQGEIPWILKTFPLGRWLAPAVVSGGGLPDFSTDDFFARTVQPGHHNFYEIVLIEPALDPALSEAARTALAKANIRQIYTFKDLAGVVIGGDAEDIRFFGFDDTVRSP